MAKQALRYVEVFYDLPTGTQHRAAVVEAASPDRALALVVEDAVAEHPEATGVREFLQRVVLPHRAEQISEAMRNGTWTGWEFPE